LRDRVDAHWAPDGNSFWYVNRLENGQKEYVAVDAVKGERSVVPEAPKGALAVRGDGRPRASAASSEQTVMRFINHSGQRARLFWIDTEGHRKEYGSLAPDESREQHTYVGHVWAIEGEDGAAL